MLTNSLGGRTSNHVHFAKASVHQLQQELGVSVDLGSCYLALYWIRASVSQHAGESAGLASCLQLDWFRFWRGLQHPHVSLQLQTEAQSSNPSVVYFMACISMWLFKIACPSCIWARVGSSSQDVKVRLLSCHLVRTCAS